MEKLEVSKEFILDLHNEVILLSVKAKIEKEFPQLFESKLEVGRWYKSPEFGSSLFCVTKINGDYATAYGFNFIGIWQDEKAEFAFSNLENKTLATPEEVETALINEAKKRGFEDGVKIIPLNKTIAKAVIDLGFKIEFKQYENEFWMGGYCLFKNGKWAEIIEKPTEMTLEQRVANLEEQLKQLK